MIHHVEPQPGAGGRAATFVALIALAVVLGAIGWEIYQTVVPPAGPPPAPTTFSGSFGNGTATCPGHKQVSGTVCTITVSPVHGEIRAVLRWDSNDPLTLSLLDSTGRSITAPVSGSNGNAGLVLDVNNLAAGSYGIRITDTTAIGPINFTVGTA